MDFSPSGVTSVALNERHVCQLVENGGLATSWAAEQAAVVLDEMVTLRDNSNTLDLANDQLL